MKFLLTFILLFQFLYGQYSDCPAFCIEDLTKKRYTANVGINELNSTNQGCLASFEGSTNRWFSICFSSSGKFEFSISPRDADNDYDFAVWEGSNCPPTTQPIRCSYAVVGTNDITGLRPSETDNSEGVGGNQWVDTINVRNGDCFIININNYASGSNRFDLILNNTTATVSCLPLSIDLIYYTYIDNKNNFIKWNSNLYFDVEKFINNEWIKIDSSLINSFNDVAITEISYYRLKNGNDYSNTIEIINPNFNKILLTPNPFDNTILLSNEIVEFEIYSMEGKLVLKGVNSKVNLQDLQSGLYFIKIENKFYKIIKN